MSTLVPLNTFAKVRLADGVAVETGLRRLPPSVAVWVRSVGAAAQFDPGAEVSNCPPEFAGFGFFPEVEIEADLAADQRLADTAFGALDAVNKRWAYTRVAVDLTPAEIAARLEAARATKWAEVKAEFSTRVLSSIPLSVTVGAKTWPVDLRSSDDYLVISGLVQMATLLAGETPAPTFKFTDATNTVQELSVAEVQGMGLQVGAHRDGLHGYKRRLRPIVFDPATTDLSTIEAIAWEDGAPPA